MKLGFGDLRLDQILGGFQGTEVIFGDIKFFLADPLELVQFFLSVQLLLCQVPVVTGWTSIGPANQCQTF